MEVWIYALLPIIALYVAGFIASDTDQLDSLRKSTAGCVLLVAVFLLCWLLLCGTWGTDWINTGADIMVDGP